MLKKFSSVVEGSVIEGQMDPAVVGKFKMTPLESSMASDLKKAAEANDSVSGLDSSIHQSACFVYFVKCNSFFSFLTNELCQSFVSVRSAVPGFFVWCVSQPCVTAVPGELRPPYFRTVRCRRLRDKLELLTHI